MKNKVKTGFRYCIERFSKDGNLIETRTFHNVMTTEGLTYLLDSSLSGGTPITAWYVVLFQSDYTPVVGDTYATPGFTEVTTAVDEANRQAWTEAGVSALALTNSASKAVYTFNSAVTLYGAAIVGGGSAASTKGDTAGGGYLISAGADTPVTTESGEVIRVTASISMADDGV